MHRPALLLASLCSALVALGCTSQNQLRRSFVSALAEQRDGRPDEAREQYKDILKTDPRFEGAANNLAVLDVDAGRLEAALKGVQTEVSAYPDELAARVNEVLLLTTLGHTEPAKRKARSLVGGFPDDPRARLAHGMALVRLKTDARKAEASLSFVMAKGTATQKAHAAFGRGVLRARERRWDEAAADFGYTTQQRRDAVAHFDRAVCLAHLNKLPEALKELQLASALDSAATPIVHLRAVLAFRAGRDDVARQAANVVLKVEPATPGVHLLLGLLALEDSRPVDAEAAFQAELKVSPESGEAWFDLGLVLVHQDKLKAAHSAFAKAAQFNPTDARGQKNRDVLAALLNL